MDKLLLRSAAQRLCTVRGDILVDHPFLGRLLMHMPFAFSDCGTACTNMKKVIFDPEFVSKLKTDKELMFVVLHELLHCILKHCTRAHKKINLAYNIACDIVVNSLLLEAIGYDEFKVAGTPVMHLAPNGREGREYSADEIYTMLLKDADGIAVYCTTEMIDTHDVWCERDGEGDGDGDCDSILEDIWNRNIAKAAKESGCGSVPGGLQRVIYDSAKAQRVDWRRLLQDFIRFANSDYTFSPPDRRYTGDFLLPSLQHEIWGSKAENICFFVDTSGSVSDVALSEAMAEICSAVNQLGSLSGYVAFFDCEVSERIPFENVDDILAMRPVGGGGTSFHVIFNYLRELPAEELPCAVVILTDGFAAYPDEKDTMNIPVIWLLADNSQDAPFGKSVHIYSDEK